MFPSTGPTYLTRLWCVIELFVFIEMGGDLEQLDVIVLDEERDVDLQVVQPTKGK